MDEEDSCAVFPIPKSEPATEVTLTQPLNRDQRDVTQDVAVTLANNPAYSIGGVSFLDAKGLTDPVPTLQLSA